MEVGRLWATLGLNKNAYDKGLDDAKSQGSGLVGFLKNAFQFTVGQGMFDLLKTGIKSAWDSSIGFNSTMQQNTIAFETMLGSADKAGKLLNELSNLAAETPFEFPDLAKAAKSLTAFGIDSTSVADKLRRIGDIASGVGTPVGDLAEIFGKAKVQGRLFAEDINQLTGRGIPIIQELSKQFGVTDSEVKKLVEDGKIGFPQLDQAFNSLTDKGGKFAGMMEGQSKSFAGMMSTLKDNVNMTLANVMKPQFEWLNSVALPKAIEFVNQLSTAFQQGGMKGVLNEIFPSSIVGVLTGIGNGIQSSFGWLSQNGSTVMGIVSGIAGAFIAYKTAVVAATISTEAHNAVSAIMTIMKGKEAIAEALSAAAKQRSTIAQWLLNAAMTANPLGIIIVAIGALVGALIYLWNTNEGFRNAIIGAWEAIKNAAVSVWNFIKAHITTILTGLLTAALGPLGLLLMYIVTHWNQVKAGTITVWNSIKEFFVNLWKGIVNTVNNIIIGFVTFIQTTFSKQIELLGNILQNIQNIFQNTWNIIKNVVLGIILIFIDLITGNFTKLQTDIEGILNNISQSMQNIWNSIKTIISDYVRLIVTTVTQAWEGLKNVISTVLTSIKSFILAVWNGILEFFKSLPKKLFDFGSQMFTSMKKGVQSTVSTVKDAIVNGITGAINWIKKLPSEAVTWGKDMIVGFVNGINDKIKNVVGAVQEVGNKIRRLLHFSRPDEGPLADYETWMPDFVDGMAKGINNSRNKLINAVQDMALGMNVNSKMNVEGKTAKEQSNSGDILNFEKMFEGAIFNVRDDEDIKKIARVIYDMIFSRGRGLGVAKT